MATFDEKDISIMVQYLTLGDDYDEAMKHFLSKAGGHGLMEISDPLPVSLADDIQHVYSMTIQRLHNVFGSEQGVLIDSMRFFYISEYNFVHGMFMSSGAYGATIYFPNIQKGALAILRPNNPETHFVRITAYTQSGGDA